MKTVMRMAVAAILAFWFTPHVYAEVVQGGEILGADSSPIKTIVVTADTASAGSLSAGNLILGFKIVAESANAQCTLCDSAGLGGCNSTTTIDEINEPTDEDMTIQMWPRPYKLVTNLSIDVTTVRACIVYYQ